EILYTAEDLPIIDGGKGNNLNDTSLVFRVRAEGQTVLFLGDVQDVGDGVMISKYGKDLKSDVVQVAHHGYPASTAEFYDLVDPEILLWPATKRRFDFCMRAVKVDRRLIEEMNVKDIYFAFEGDAALEMPIKPRENAVLPDTFVPLKPLTAVCEFVGVKRAPDISDPNDPLWNASPVFRAVHDLYPAPGPGEDSGTFRALWKDDRLFLNIRFDKKPVSDPSRFGSLDSDCVRLYYSAYPVCDRMTLWADVRGNRDFIENIKFYSEEKLVRGEKIFCTDLNRCPAKVFTDENGFTVCAALKLGRPREKGDIIGFNLEFNGVPSVSSNRAYSLSFADRDQDIIPALSPSSLAFVKLI
ncbi:MAG: hypothetical protein IJV00_10910, partial [Clostridia bacterium]|nr:hypothetical protein [Clostridia bacterium]